MEHYFVGKRAKPSFLVSVQKTKKNVTIYKPDGASKNEEFFEKYYLGQVLVETKYSDIIFINKPVKFKNHYEYVPEIILKIKGKYYMVSDKMKELL